MNITNCTSLGWEVETSRTWCSLDPVYQGNWQYCRNICTEGPSNCPFGYEQTGLHVYTCVGNLNAFSAQVEPNLPTKVWELPTNASMYQLDVTAPSEFILTLVDDE